MLLDLDGTLVDTMPALRSAYCEFLGRRGVQASDSEFERYNGVPLTDVVEGLARTHGIDGRLEALYSEYLEILAGGYATEAQAMPGASELVEEARARDAKIGVVTSAPHDLALEVLSRIGIGADVLIGGDDISPGKPDPAPYREAMRRTGVASARTVALEDSETGVRSANAAGLRCIAVGAAASSARAWATRRSLEEARPLVSSLLDGKAVAVSATQAEIRVVESDPRCSAIESAAIENAWAVARSANDELFDGELLSVMRWRRSEGALLIDAIVAGYRELVAQRAGASFGIRPLGVSAVTIVGDTVVVGRRSTRVTQYPSRWKLAASGTLPVTEAADPCFHLAAELAEETGIAPQQISSISTLGLIEDLGEDCFDLCYRVDVGGDVSLRSVTGEYSELRLVTLAEARELAQTRESIPGMARMLELLGAVTA